MDVLAKWRKRIRCENADTAKDLDEIRSVYRSIRSRCRAAGDRRTELEATKAEAKLLGLEAPTRSEHVVEISQEDLAAKIDLLVKQMRANKAKQDEQK